MNFGSKFLSLSEFLSQLKLTAEKEYSSPEGKTCDFRILLNIIHVMGLEGGRKKKDYEGKK